MNPRNASDSVNASGRYTCIRCGWTWSPRPKSPDPPRACARCRSAYWQTAPTSCRGNRPDNPKWQAQRELVEGRKRARRLARLRSRAAELGFRLVPVDNPSARTSSWNANHPLVCRLTACASRSPSRPKGRALLHRPRRRPRQPGGRPGSRRRGTDAPAPGRYSLPDTRTTVYSRVRVHPRVIGRSVALRHTPAQSFTTHTRIIGILLPMMRDTRGIGTEDGGREIGPKSSPLMCFLWKYGQNTDART